MAREPEYSVVHSAVGRVSSADHGTALAAAAAGLQTGYDSAYTNFAKPMMPAITDQGVSDAKAEFLNRETIDDADLTDIVQNNKAVDAYQDQESPLYSGEQTSDAQALYTEQIADALGHASAVGQAFQPREQRRNKGVRNEWHCRR